MKKRPLVSVIIPTYNRKKMAERLIKSIMISTYKNIEIVVIDDASSDGTSKHLRKIFRGKEKVKIFTNKKNLFAAGSKNVGQKKAIGEFFLFIDDDNIVEKHMIEELVNFMEKNKIAGEVGPINYNFHTKKVLLSFSKRSMWTTKTKHVRSLKSLGYKSFWETTDIPNSFMVRRKSVKGINFNSKFGIMYEESDYAYKIKKSGYKIYMVKSAKIYHDLYSSGVDDYIAHFIEDSRRPFTFARNRIMFHSMYSNKIQKIGIFFFWIWVFAGYYSYKFFTYKASKEIRKKTDAVFNYWKGTVNGLFLIYNGQSYGK